MMMDVILLHGIFRTARSMRGLGRFLEARGHRVLNLDYPSTAYDIPALVDHIHPAITAFVADGQAPLAIVGYSMGGLVARAYLTRHRPPRFDRLVQLASPNHGSEVADLLQNNSIYRRYYGPAGQQLITRWATRDTVLGPVDYPLHIVAGSSAVEPFGWLLLPKPNDGKVALASTKLPQMASHQVVPVCHTWFPHSRTVWQCTATLLER